MEFSNYGVQPPSSSPSSVYNKHVVVPQSQISSSSSSPSPITVPSAPPAPPSHSSSVASSPSTSRPDNREISPQGRYIKLEEKLGSGAYKDVWRAYDTNNGFEVAWNVVKLNRIPPSERKRIKTEVKLLKDIEHKNVIRYYNSWVDREKEQIIFVTEMMSSGSLKEYLRKNTMIRWSAVKRWCRQILTGLEFLHANHIIHRDIKCDNVFINGNTGDLRIGDLGLSTRITEERGAFTSNGSLEHRQMTTVTLTCLGTPEFMAPEMYEENYNEKVDIYAFGMCVLEMVTGLTPYHRCTSAAQVYRKVMNGELPPELEIVAAANSQACEFIKACLLKHDSRPTATALLQTPFMAQANPQEDAKEVRSKVHSKFFTQDMAITEEDEEERDEDSGSDDAIDGRLSPTNQAHNSTKERERDRETVVSSLASSVVSSPAGPTDNIHSPSSHSSTSTLVQHIVGNGSHPIPFSLKGEEINIMPSIIECTNNGGMSGSRVRTTLLSECENSDRSHGSVYPIDNASASTHSTGSGVLTARTVSTSSEVNTAEIPLMSPKSLLDKKLGSSGNISQAPISTTTDSHDKVNSDPVNLDMGNKGDESNIIQKEDGEGDCHHSILILDVLDHTEKSNTIVLKFKLLELDKQVSNSPIGNIGGSPSKPHPEQMNNNDIVIREKEKDKKIHLAIDFDYDLVHDSSLQEIIDEMCQLEEFQHLPQPLTKMEKQQLIHYFEPIINAAKIILNEDNQKATDLSVIHNNRWMSIADRALFRLIFGSSPSEYQRVDVEIAAITVIEAFSRECPGYFCLASKLLTLIQKMQEPQLSMEARPLTITETLDPASVVPPSISAPSFQPSAVLFSVTSVTTSESLSTSDSMVAPSPVKFISPGNNGDSEKKDCADAINDSSAPQSTQDDEVELALKSNPEYLDLLQSYMTAIQRIEKDYSNKLSSIQQQREKTEKAIQLEIEQLMQRQIDLDKQMDIMQIKYKERMAEFSARKNQALEERLEKQKKLFK